MTSPNLKRVQSDFARSHQIMRDLDVLPWAPRRMNYAANIASGLAIALLIVGIAVWGGWL